MIPLVETAREAAGVFERGIAAAGAFDVAPAFVFAAAIVAAAFAPAPPERPRLRELAALVAPALAGLGLCALGALFRSSEPTQAGRVALRTMAAVVAATALGSGWVVWRARGYRAFAGGIVAFQMIYVLAIWSAAAAAVAQDWT